MKLLFENHTNYIYKVEDYGDILKFECNKYILYNPSIFKWMVIDDIGKELFEQIISCHDIGIVRRNIKKKYNISEQVFEEDAMGFITQLYDEGYLSNCVTEDKALWLKKTFNNNTIENYYFDDIYISLSELCNLKCQYCFNDEKRKKRKKEKVLTINEIVAVLEEYRNMGGRGVVFTGGEPTLNPDFINICKEAKNTGLRTTVITNGTLLNRYDVSDVVKYIDKLTLSIDSTNDDIQMQLWNVDTYSYQNNILPFLEKLNKYVGDEEINYSVFIMPVINKINKDYIGELYAKVTNTLRNCTVNWSCSKYGKIGRKLIDEQLSVTENEYASSLWNALKGKMPEIDLLQYIMSKGGKELLLNTPHKVMCSPNFFVTNYGDVFPCQGLEECANYLGNIRESKLKDMFFEDKFQKILKNLRLENVNNCKDCELNICCSNGIGRLCINEREPNCKERIVQKMYLKTI